MTLPANIKTFHMETTDIKSAGAEMEKFACWSVRSSEHDKTSDKIYSFAQKSDGCVIRIPGPSDESTEIPEELPDGFLLSDDYNSSFPVQPATSHAVNLNAANFVAPAPKAKRLNGTGRSNEDSDLFSMLHYTLFARR
ncbi:hypothetical protein CVT25_003852 [Psilocybe cyanescens]|uniref:Uncharacterized protein n=1 Tax=Psilocybe cyanescens TaxID=93625 RepID=A0A409WY19_PSICY|nr:hypothetical protein CVT25_003852 [Psilocybe cyanescens]